MDFCKHDFGFAVWTSHRSPPPKIKWFESIFWRGIKFISLVFLINSNSTMFVLHRYVKCVWVCEIVLVGPGGRRETVFTVLWLERTCNLWRCIKKKKKYCKILTVAKNRAHLYSFRMDTWQCKRNIILLYPKECNCAHAQKNMFLWKYMYKYMTKYI